MRARHHTRRNATQTTDAAAFHQLVTTIAKVLAVAVAARIVLAIF